MIVPLLVVLGVGALLVAQSQRAAGSAVAAAQAAAWSGALPPAGDQSSLESGWQGTTLGPGGSDSPLGPAAGQTGDLPLSVAPGPVAAPAVTR